MYKLLILTSICIFPCLVSIATITECSTVLLLKYLIGARIEFVDCDGVRLCVIDSHLPILIDGHVIFRIGVVSWPLWDSRRQTDTVWSWISKLSLCCNIEFIE